MRQRPLVTWPVRTPIIDVGGVVEPGSV